MSMQGSPLPALLTRNLPEKVQVTVNRHFAERFTLIEHGDEVALVPRPQ